MPLLPHDARRSLLAAALTAAIAIGVAGTSLGAQSSDAPTAPAQSAAPARDECLGFAFGTWTPPLDARAAGHRSGTRADTTPQAPNGREWAMRLETQRDTTLMLFPPWWPAGVAIRLPRSVDTTADTAAAPTSHPVRHSAPHRRGAK